MAVDRWFGGINKFENRWNSGVWYADPTKDTYVVKATFRGERTVPDGKLILFANPVHSQLNPEALEVKIVDGDVFSLRDKTVYDIFYKLKAGTKAYVMGDPNGTTALSYVIVIVELGQSVSRSRNQVLAEMNASNTYCLVGHYNFTSNPTVVQQFDEQINNKLIQQPGLADTPAVADQLQVVSTNGNDTALGTGCRTLEFDYWDSDWVLNENNTVTMDGTTPVDIIATYTDVFVIKRVYGKTFGSLGRNAGYITFQDV